MFLVAFRGHNGAVFAQAPHGPKKSDAEGEHNPRMDEAAAVDWCLHRRFFWKVD